MRLLIFTLLIILIAFLSLQYLTSSLSSGLEPAKSISANKINSVKTTLKLHVNELADKTGERNVLNKWDNLKISAEYIVNEFNKYGYSVNKQEFSSNNQIVKNLEIVLPGTLKSEENIIVGAHYDSAIGTPGANDNATGVAALLYLAESLAGTKNKRSLRIVAFTNEEPPYFQTEKMGSFQYAKDLSERNINVTTMLSLETMGFFTNEPGSQTYPFPLKFFYPDKGNFIGFISNIKSRNLVRSLVKSYQSHSSVAAEGAALPAFIPGVGWSDHWSFWQFGFPAVMITDTAPFRYPHYHQESDTPDKIDFENFTKVTLGLEQLILEILNPSEL